MSLEILSDIDAAVAESPEGARIPLGAMALGTLVHLEPATALARFEALPEPVARVVILQAAGFGRVLTPEVATAFRARLAPLATGDWNARDLPLALWAGSDWVEAILPTLDPLFDGWRVICGALDAGLGTDWTSGLALAERWLATCPNGLDRARLALLRARLEADDAEALALTSTIQDPAIRLEACFERAVRALRGLSPAWAAIATLPEADSAAMLGPLLPLRRAAILARTGTEGAQVALDQAFSGLEAQPVDYRAKVTGDYAFAGAAIGVEAATRVVDRLQRDVAVLKSAARGTAVYATVDGLRWLSARAALAKLLPTLRALAKAVDDDAAAPGIHAAMVQLAVLNDDVPTEAMIAALGDRLARQHAVAGGHTTLSRAGRTLASVKPDAARDLAARLRDPIQRVMWHVGRLQACLDR